MNGLKGFDIRDLDVKGFEPTGGELMGLKGLGTRVLDVKGFEPFGGE